MVTDPYYEKKMSDLIEGVPITLSEARERIEQLENQVSALRTAIEAVCSCVLSLEYKAGLSRLR